MRVAVIDGQGGRMGQMVIERVRSEGIVCELIAIGTNSIAASAMLKAGADAGASGENPVVAASRSADVIIGPVGIIAADSMLGEVTPAMAVAIGQSGARKILIPVNLCNNFIVGVRPQPLAKLIAEAVEQLKPEQSRQKPE
ncbi:MAG: DUF3842 family protein [Oscillospiraceae bacterium]|nr:DUF3842 family protein [Oscillospiraceae bacterium]